MNSSRSPVLLHVESHERLADGDLPPVVPAAKAPQMARADVAPRRCSRVDLKLLEPFQDRVVGAELGGDCLKGALPLRALHREHPRDARLREHPREGRPF